MGAPSSLFVKGRGRKGPLIDRNKCLWLCKTMRFSFFVLKQKILYLKKHTKVKYIKQTWFWRENTIYQEEEAEMD